MRLCDRHRVRWVNYATCDTSGTCSSFSVQIYIHRKKLRLLALVAEHYGSYLQADRYLYKVVDRPSEFNVFFLLITSYNSSYIPRFLEYIILINSYG